MTLTELKSSLRGTQRSATATAIVTVATIGLAVVATVTIDAFPTASNIRA